MDFKTSEQQQLAYDLRQGYAKLVTEHMVDVYMARKESNYPDYFKALENLYTIVAHKITKPEKAGKKDNKKFKTYLELSAEFIKLSSTYPDVYFGRSKNKEVSLFEMALRIMERHLYAMMDEGKMFGATKDRRGL